jgi:hypothetical protein
MKTKATIMCSYVLINRNSGRIDAISETKQYLRETGYQLVSAEEADAANVPYDLYTLQVGDLNKLRLGIKFQPSLPDPVGHAVWPAEEAAAA